MGFEGVSCFDLERLNCATMQGVIEHTIEAIEALLEEAQDVLPQLGVEKAPEISGAEFLRDSIPASSSI